LAWRRRGFTTSSLKLGAVRCLGWDACPGPMEMVYNIDGYPLRESLLPWMSLEDWGFRAVAHAASDIVAVGAVPVAAWYSLGVPGWLEAVEAAKGVGLAADMLNLSVLKSDYNRAGEGWIDVAMVGLPMGRRVVSRRGARPGDVLYQVGYLGYGLAERLALEERLDHDRVRGLARRLPPVRAARAVSYYASASQDNSDGWGATLASLSRWSGVGIVVERLVPDPDVWALLSGAGVGEGDLFESWEDLNLAVLVPAEQAGRFEEECRRRRVVCFRAGRAVDGEGVYYKGRRIEPGGWSWS